MTEDIQKIEFLPQPLLPALAWCVQLERGSNTAVVEHGAAVQVRDNWFVAGVWNGDYLQTDFSDATFFAGTGGQIQNNRLEIHNGTANQDVVYCHRTGKKCWISNSLTYLMVVAGLSPAPSIQYYEQFLMFFDSRGIFREARSLPMKRGSLERYESHILTLDNAFNLSMRLRPNAQLPEGYAPYVDLLKQTTRAIIENSEHPDRASRYASMVQVSRGYDSLALAVIVRQCGGEFASSFYTQKGDKTNHEDDAIEAMQTLGYQADHYLKTYPLSREPGTIPEAPFCIVPPALELPVYNMRPALQNRLSFNGYFGDQIFSKHELDRIPDLREDYHIGSTGYLGAYEFRLDINCIAVKLFAFGWPDFPKMWALTDSPAMDEWSVEGAYDRPIPRRIIVEGGLTHEDIGDKKRFTQYQWESNLKKLSPESRPDYIEFLCETTGKKWHLEQFRKRRARLPFLFQWGHHHYKTRFSASHLGDAAS